ncbi:Transmembrane protein 205 like protein [Argiope bruennichi]|uniref:Transmembrane protein 205 like protein n=1 Tax=Argiope bruennichi TaxID=94029 RepID=A0A8T0E8B3_ARGBR|nr:Transmembrane protein 205 like protein [Argiope bruennichi]
MTGSCSPNTMITLRIPEFSKMMPHRLHISLYIRLSRCTHLVTGAALAYAAFFMLTAGDRKPSSSSSITLLYLASFATHYGTQIWMTFISGIVLFFNLPRKIFGLVQRHLFPKYFLLNSMLGFLTLWIFVLQNPESTAQRWNLAICFLCDLAGMVYIVPDMIQTMTDRAKIEEEAGVGQDVVGRFKPGQLLTSCPKYARLHSRFRTFHGLCAVVNLLAMACNTLHMYHIACKLIHR